MSAAEGVVGRIALRPPFGRRRLMRRLPFRVLTLRCLDRLGSLVTESEEQSSVLVA